MNAFDQFPEIPRLPIEARLQLLEAIWESIAHEESQLPLNDALKEELDRRLADMDANPGDELTWEEVDESLRARP